MATRQEIIEEIKFDLGAPTVKVEIDDTVWDVLFRKALRWFKAKKGHIISAPVPLEDGKVEYDWPAGAYAIHDVVLPRRSDIADILSLGFFDIVPAGYVLGGTQTSGGMRFDISAYVNLLQNLEMRRRVYTAEPDYFVLEHPIKKIVITVRSDVAFSLNTTPALMIVYYKKDDIDVPDLIGRDSEIFYKYCLAKSKILLGRIRSKYSAYPSAGGTINMDGESLLSEGNQELQAVEMEIDESQGNTGGIVIG